MNKKKIKRIVASSLTVTMTTISANCYLGNNEAYAEKKSLECEQIEVLENIFKSDSKRLEEEFEVKRQEYLEAKRIEEERIQRELEQQRRLEEERRAFEEAERVRIQNVGVNLDNVLEVSNITVDELIAVFDFYDYSKPMKELAWIIVEAERTYQINAFVLSGIISWESSYNTSKRATDGSNNVLGWGVYSPEAEGINASSKYENIINACEFLRSAYLTEGGLYYNGLSTFHLNLHYCLDENGQANMEWSKGINSIAKNYEWVYKYLFVNN